MEENLKESKKLVEMPDKYGLPTDDELQAEFEKRKSEIAAKRKSLEDEEEAKRKEQHVKIMKYGNPTKILNRIDNSKGADWFNKAFNYLVPSEGQSDTLAGELIRAYSKIKYRAYNDGDLFYMGYGLETCGGAAKFIDDNCEEAQELLGEIVTNSLDNSDYLEKIEELGDVIEHYIKTNTDLLITPNEEDMLAYRDDDY